jgi:hypothetical protein
MMLTDSQHTTATLIAKSFNSELLAFFDEYKKQHKPIEVNFRELVYELKGTDRYSHLIHRYPAKLIAHIPFFFLNNTIISKPGEWVMDPFCGSGTVLLESLLAGRNAVGSDSNPLARLISKVKTKPLDTLVLTRLSEELKLKINRIGSGKVPNVVNVDYWFSERVKNELALIKQSIGDINDLEYRNFFMICFSSCVKHVSFADPRVSVPVRLNYKKYPEGHQLRKEAKEKIESLEHLCVIDRFFQQVNDNIKRIQSLETELNEDLRCELFDDARIHSLDKIKTLGAAKGVSLVITSPPYAGAQKYIRSSSLNLGWLGYTDFESLRDHEKRNIGREHYNCFEYRVLCKTGILKADELLTEIFEVNPLRAHIAATYLLEMRAAFESVVSTMKTGGYFVLVAANNEVCKKEFLTREYLLQILIDLGLSLELEMVDDIQSYGLMTKRNKSASIITREWVMVLKK